jgi:hypothetical protein
MIATGARVDRLIPLYAIGVFTSFTMSQSGMAKHHKTKKEPGWRKGIVINGTGAVLSFIVDIVILVTKFTSGAWVIVLLVPIMVLALTRLNKQYEAEAEELQEDAPRATEAPILGRHVVLVLIDEINLASARAIQYARTLMPDELRAVHFVVDSAHADRLSEEWQRLGLARLTLELIDCPDRRLARAAVELVAETLAGGETEVSVLLPRMVYSRMWHRLLHDRTAGQIAEAVADLPHANLTFVPYHLGHARRGADGSRSRFARAGRLVPSATNGKRDARRSASSHGVETFISPDEVPEGAVPISSVTYRQRARVAGRIRAVRVQPWSGIATLECSLVDQTGGLTLVFLGRRHVSGISPGVRVVAEGMIGEHGGHLAMLNPEYRILAGFDQQVSVPPSSH